MFYSFSFSNVGNFLIMKFQSGKSGVWISEPKCEPPYGICILLQDERKVSLILTMPYCWQKITTSLSLSGRQAWKQADDG